MAKVFFIPDGPKNLAALFPGFDFSLVTEYNVYLLDSDGGIIATTPTYKVTKPCEDNIRIHFINYLGGIDSINFCLQTKEHESKSDALQVPLQSSLNKPDHSLARFNVKGNDTYTCATTEFNEVEMDWLDELFDTPQAWIEWTGTQDQQDSYLPIVILDAKTTKVQQEDRFVYNVTVQFKMSNERIIIRNNVTQ